MKKDSREGRTATRTALAAAGSIIVLSGVGWLGLRVEPGEMLGADAVELSPDLPEPVLRYYGEVADDETPAAGTAVVWGRGEFSLNGLWFPARFVAYYDVPGRAFRRDMELTWFGRPVFRGRARDRARRDAAEGNVER